MTIEFNRNLGDTPIIALPSFDVLPTPNTTTGVTDSSATADTNISLQKEGAITTPSVDLSKMSTLTQPKSSKMPSIAKYGLIGGGVIAIAGLLYLALRGKKHERQERVYQNPNEQFKPDYKVVNDIKDKIITLHKSGSKGLGTVSMTLIDDLRHFGFTRKDATKTVQLALSKAMNEIYQKNPLDVHKMTYEQLMNARKTALRFGAYGDAKRLKNIADRMKGIVHHVKSKVSFKSVESTIEPMTSKAIIPEAVAEQVPVIKHKIKGTMKLHRPTGSSKADMREDVRQEKVFKSYIRSLKKEGFTYKLVDDDEGNTVIEYHNPRHKRRLAYHNPIIAALVSNDKTRKSNIYSDGKGKVTAHRWFSYKTTFGDNSSGYEERYNNEKEAMFKEKKWISETNPIDKAAEVFTKFHGFEPTKLKEVEVPDEYPDELVLIGKADEVLYRSNKKNGAPNRDGKEKSYVHDFKKGALWATDKEGKGLYLINPELKVQPEGLVH